MIRDGAELTAAQTIEFEVFGFGPLSGVGNRGHTAPADFRILPVRR